jgi:hypothetical protein
MEGLMPKAESANCRDGSQVTPAGLKNTALASSAAAAVPA